MVLSEPQKGLLLHAPLCLSNTFGGLVDDDDMLHLVGALRVGQTMALAAVPLTLTMQLPLHWWLTPHGSLAQQRGRLIDLHPVLQRRVLTEVVLLRSGGISYPECILIWFNSGVITTLNRRAERCSQILSLPFAPAGLQNSQF